MEYVEGETLKDHIRREGRYTRARRCASPSSCWRRPGGPRRPHRPPRHQVAEHPDRRGRHGEGHRLRHRQGRRLADDRGRLHPGHGPVPGPRAGQGRARRRAHRPLLGRRRLLRDADRLAALPRRQRRHRGPQARQRAAGRTGRARAGLPYSLNQIVSRRSPKTPTMRYRTAAEFSADLVAARSGGPLLAAGYDPIARPHDGAGAGGRRRGHDPGAAQGGRRGGRRAAPGPRPAPGGPGRQAPPALAVALDRPRRLSRDRRRRRCVVWKSFFGGTTLTVPRSWARPRRPPRRSCRAQASPSRRTTTTPTSSAGPRHPAAARERRQARQGRHRRHLGEPRAGHHHPDRLHGLDAHGRGNWLVKYGLVGKELSGTSATIAKGKVYKQSPLPGITVKPRRHRQLLGQSRPAPGERARPVGARSVRGGGALQAVGLVLGTPLAADQHHGARRSGDKPEPGGRHDGRQGQHRDHRGEQRHADAERQLPRPTGTPVAMPSVVTMPLAAAEQLLTNDGFVVAPPSTARARWARASSTTSRPRAATATTSGSTVTIWVGK